MAAQRIPDNSGKSFTFKKDNLVVMGTPNESYGYMYCAVWLE